MLKPMQFAGKVCSAQAKHNVAVVKKINEVKNNIYIFFFFLCEIRYFGSFHRVDFVSRNNTDSLPILNSYKGQAIYLKPKAIYLLRKLKNTMSAQHLLYPDIIHDKRLTQFNLFSSYLCFH